MRKIGTKKKGSTMVWAFVIIFVSLLLSIALGMVVYTFNTVNDVMSIDVDIGQVNLKNVSDTTFGQINSGIIDNADTIGIIALLGMCLLMLINGYFIGSQNPKMFLVIDIFLLALFFIPAVYVSQIYSTFINSSTVFSATFTDIIPKTSKFMLNLPVIVAVTGLLTMLISYAGIRRDDEPRGGNVNVLGQ